MTKKEKADKQRKSLAAMRPSHDYLITPRPPPPVNASLINVPINWNSHYSDYISRMKCDVILRLQFTLFVYSVSICNDSGEKEENEEVETEGGE